MYNKKTKTQSPFFKFEDVNMNTSLEGSLDRVTSLEDLDGTLNEDIKETIKRDLFAVFNKFKYVVQPTRIVRSSNSSKNKTRQQHQQDAPLLYDWDLWGPLILCTLMAFLLQTSNNHGANFTDVFIIVWCGAAVVTVNAQLLGGKISFFQSVCVLGYCILPLTSALIICKILLFFGGSSSSSNGSGAATFSIRAFVVLVALGWSIFSANTFLGYSQPYGKKALAHYPICLFYVVIAWVVITHYP